MREATCERHKLAFIIADRRFSGFFLGFLPFGSFKTDGRLFSDFEGCPQRWILKSFRRFKLVFGLRLMAGNKVLG
jgi:hypothetical protein